MVASSTTSDKEIGQIPSALGVAAQRPCFFVAPPRRCPYIDSSLRLESELFRPQQMTCYFWDRTLAPVSNVLLDQVMCSRDQFDGPEHLLIPLQDDPKSLLLAEKQEK